MKKLLSVNHKWIFSGLLGALILLMTIFQTDTSLAHPPRQEGDQPDFTVTTQTAPDGSTTIQSQETRLDQSYFAANGSLEGLEITPTGLALAGGETGGAYVSGVIHSPLAFTTDIVPLWQAEIPEGAGLLLETRLSYDGDTWSEWLENPEAFYPVRDDQHGGSLIWVSNEQVALQFRVTLQSGGVSPTLNSLTLIFNDTSDGPTDGEIARQMAEQQEAAIASTGTCPAKPPVISRTDWGCPDGQDSPRRPPVYQPITHIIIHQAETPNHPAPYDQWSGWVRSVWNYHANCLWWGDVGYNYIIAPNGNIYEGRAGGDDVVGIHDTHNDGSMAIGFLGCYGDCDDPNLSVVDPSPAMLESAEKLMAWKASQKGLNPLGEGPYGHWGDVPVIAGGRDVTWTTSPGARLYDQLPNLRDGAKAKIDQCSPTPNGTTVFVDPADTKLCEGGSAIVTTKVRVAKVANMQGFAFKLNFDPNLVRVADADPNTPEIEVRVGSDFGGGNFFLAKNEVENGVINLAGTFHNTDPFDGDAVLAEIDWLPVNKGNSALTFDEVKLSDPDAIAIPRQIINGSVEVAQCIGLMVSGQVRLQGRNNYGGALVSNGTEETQTNPDGSFSLSGDDALTVKLPGYLSAQADVRIKIELGQAGNGGDVNLGVITLLAGDVNDDDLVDIFDLAYLASRYDSADPVADLNADGTVDIFDLTITAGNYGQQGPLTDWR